MARGGGEGSRLGIGTEATGEFQGITGNADVAPSRAVGLRTGGCRARNILGVMVAGSDLTRDF